MSKTKAYLIAVYNKLENFKVEEFSKAISSNYISMPVTGENWFVILSEENSLPIYKKLDEKTGGVVNFMVAELSTNWYGNLPQEVFDWMKEKLPDMPIST